jgi:hypothetical protein
MPARSKHDVGGTAAKKMQGCGVSLPLLSLQHITLALCPCDRLLCCCKPLSMPVRLRSLYVCLLNQRMAKAAVRRQSLSYSMMLLQQGLDAAVLVHASRAA